MQRWTEIAEAYSEPTQVYKVGFFCKNNYLSPQKASC